MLVPQWPERQTVARAAAKDAATVYANAPDAESGRAQAHVNRLDKRPSNHGLPPGCDDGRARPATGAVRAP